jgi:hypothetical protein
MPQSEECQELREEILQLLHAQMQALQQPSRLSDVELSACYRRQEKVGELRDLLLIALNPHAAPAPDSADLSSAPIPSATSSSPASQAAVGM